MELKLLGNHMIYKCFLLCIFISLLSSNTYSWKFQEHFALGKKAYENSCDLLMKIDNKQLNHTSIRIRDIYLCPSDKDLLNELSSKYGRASAIAGDHIEDPEHFFSGYGEISTNSVIKYGTLASHNINHFWPDVKRHFLSHQIKSLTYARDFHDKLMNGKVLDQEYFVIQKAIMYQAFGSHFLQDAFSIGHSGFSRGGTNAEVSNLFHNYFNCNGSKLYYAPSNDLWDAYGDGQLNLDSDDNLKDDANHHNHQNQIRIIEANTEALYMVMKSLLTATTYQETDLANIKLPTHTSNRFHQPLMRFNDTKLTCFGRKNGSRSNLINVFSYDKSKEDCLMPIDALGTKPVRKFISLDLMHQSVVPDKQGEDIYSGGGARLNIDSLFGWNPVSYGLYVERNKLSDAQTVNATGISITLPYQFGDAAEHKIRVGRSHSRLGTDELDDHIGLQLGYGYYIPFPNKPFSVFLSGTYVCGWSDHTYSCNDDYSYGMLSFGIAGILRLIGGGYTESRIH